MQASSVWRVIRLAPREVTELSEVSLQSILMKELVTFRRSQGNYEVNERVPQKSVQPGWSSLVAPLKLSSSAVGGSEPPSNRRLYVDH